MRAVLSKTVGGPSSLVVEEVLDPTPRAGEVVIEVKAVGINFPDTLIIEDKYQFRPERPFSPGGEVAGVVEAVGEGVKGVFKGDRVIAVPGWGGLVERIAVRADSLIRMPDAMSFEEAAGLVLTIPPELLDPLVGDLDAGPGVARGDHTHIPPIAGQSIGSPLGRPLTAPIATSRGWLGSRCTRRGTIVRVMVAKGRL
jgi:hypothetical protein